MLGPDKLNPMGKTNAESWLNVKKQDSKTKEHRSAAEPAEPTQSTDEKQGSSVQ